jgi:Ca-activated chloride channel family protein
MSPLTLDKAFLLDRLYKIDTGMIEDGTAIGTALARSVRQLVDREAKSKVVVLLTDGENNAGAITPVQAAQTAQSFWRQSLHYRSWN